MLQIHLPNIALCAFLRNVQKMEGIRKNLEDLYDLMSEIQAEGQSAGSFTQEQLGLNPSNLS